jgi:transposase
MERRRQWCSNQWRTTGNCERHWRTQGACLFSKRLERGRFVWPAAKDGKIRLSPSQLSMLLEGIDWRMPQKTWRPLKTG